MESELIRWLRGRFPQPETLRLGLGDDGAIVRLKAGECVVAVDTVADEVDFRLEEIDPRRAGRKALAVNLSDLAAMASRPVAAVVALSLPRGGAAGRNALELGQAVMEGMAPLAERYGVAIAGGDIHVWEHPLTISVTVLGESPARPLTRSGAKPGDWVLVTGELGGSLLGKHLDFEPRVEEALLLNERYRLHAGMDISDGLALDLSRLAAESECGAVVRVADVPISAAAEQLAREANDGTTALDHALGDGEDFELLLAVPEEEARRMLAERPLNVPLTAIGQFVAEKGLWQVDAQGVKSPLEPRGWEHGG